MSLTSKKRVTLVEQQSSFGVTDPSSHAKRQVEELDKTAKKSSEKRKICNEQMAHDKKELAHLEEQIKAIHHNYDPLCIQLEENIKKKKDLLEKLNACQKEEHRVMGVMKNVVNQRKIDDAKLIRKMVSQQLKDLRGYSLEPESTYYQKK